MCVFFFSNHKNINHLTEEKNITNLFDSFVIFFNTFYLDSYKMDTQKLCGKLRFFFFVRMNIARMSESENPELPNSEKSVV